LKAARFGPKYAGSKDNWPKISFEFGAEIIVNNIWEHLEYLSWEQRDLDQK